MNWGISKRHLFQVTERFFFGTQPITSISNAKDFFLECMPTTHHFEVYFLARKEIGKFDKTLKTFDINILDDLPEEVKAIADQHGLTREEGEVYVEVSEISSYDIHSGLRAAEERMDNVRDLVLLYSHKKPLTWKSTAIVKQCCLSHPVIATSPKSAVQRIADLRPQLAAPRLQYLLENVHLVDGPDGDRFNRIVDLHGLCAIQDAPETQLLNLWICIETLIPSEPSRNKINNILQTALPPLMLIYSRRLVRNLLRDMIEWNKKVTMRLLNKADGNSAEHTIKLLSFLSPDCEDLRKELYEKLDEFPLLRYRIFSLAETFSKKEKFQKLLAEHHKKVGWQIRRIYRTRNLLVHSGKTPSYLATLIENSHDYLDGMINEILELSCGPRRISTFRQAFEFFRLQFESYEKRIKALDTIDRSNIATLYFPRPSRSTVAELLINHTNLLAQK